MKVLFAVSNEEISESIVKKYQKEYKQIISYKNVYYFNAILKELQRDKTYDRIVISEDLETFSHTQYDQIDKFIFEKLDGISDEAFNQDGDSIPIVLICTDRRTKSDQMLSKFFGIGIYNAVIGNDRSIEEVCNLIRKPRSKRDAKTYYKIESEDVNYKPENENDVSEVEIQNILAHFKRLGKNEAKYVESFDNIAAQYNDMQLKVICKFLPLNVRAVLEESSPKYQKLISYNKKVSKDLKKPENVEKVNKGTTEKLLKLKDHDNILSNPVVIPSAIKTEGKRKLTRAPKVVQTQNNIDEIEKIVEPEATQMTQTREVKQEPITNVEEIKTEPVNENVVVEAPKKRRGRPPKKQVAEQEVQKPKRGRGRPPKKEKLEEENTVLPGFEDVNDNINDTVLPGFDDYNNQKDENDTILPGFEDFDSKEPENDTVLPGFDDYNTSQESNNIELPGIDDDDWADEKETIRVINSSSSAKSNTPTNYSNNNVSNNDYNNNQYKPTSENYLAKNEAEEIDNVDISNLLTSDKKIACFVGTSKNGTSFIINNIAQILSANGINTAILDTTKNRNAYYIYTENEEELRKKAYSCIDNLRRGNPAGINVSKNLDVYTTLPGENGDINDAQNIMQTLVSNYSLVILDCDFDTNIEYFKIVQEIYLVQSMDILTIQPLTTYLRELKAKGALQEEKLRIVINKTKQVRSLTAMAIIGGMAFYNDPAMSFMTELFNKDEVPYCVIPFEDQTYSKYLEGLVNCKITTNGYSKNFMSAMSKLTSMVYPLIAKDAAKRINQPNAGYYANKTTTFNPNMNSTLDKMKKNL